LWDKEYVGPEKGVTWRRFPVNEREGEVEGAEKFKKRERLSHGGKNACGGRKTNRQVDAAKRTM